MSQIEIQSEYGEQLGEFQCQPDWSFIHSFGGDGVTANDEPDEKPSPCDQATPSENLEEQFVTSDQIKMQAPQDIQRRVVSVINGKYECDQCHKTYSSRQGLNNHKQSVHEGVKYSCDECEYQTTTQKQLTRHIQSKHEGVKYACDQCDHQATRQEHLIVHIQSKHEGIKYACDQCDQQFTQKAHLWTHIKKKHGV